MIDKLIDSPWFLRITALALTLLMFFTVKSETNGDQNTTTTSDSQTEVLHDVPVDVLYDNENLIVTGVPKTVDVSVKGPLALVYQTKAFKDYKVYLDLSKATIGHHKVKLKYKGFNNKLNVQVQPSTIDVSIEEKVTRTFKVDPDFNEDQLASNYFVKSISVNPKEVVVTGAKSVIDSIAYVKAMLSGESEVTESFTKQAPIKVLDRDMNRLDVLSNPSTVPVKVDIGEYNKEVPITLNVKGTPKNNLKVKSLNAETDHITVFGAKDELDQISSLTVDVDVSNLKKSKDIIVNIPKPDGVTKLSTNQLKVHVDLNDINQKEDGVSNDQTTSSTTFNNVKVKVKNLDTSQYTIVNEGSQLVSVVVSGNEKKIANVKASDINLFVDAQNVEVGTNILKIQGSSPSGTTWNAIPSSIKLSIS